ncbi:MAG TPA: hypothetical protein VHN36_18260 [Ilumatobacteraceae bacterium]|nr:hypothetical protein [Ilumatobacteraceae bacterium]
MTTRQALQATSEQLTLLPVSELPLQFRLDQRTRERGLAHVAAIRRQLAAKSSDVRATSTSSETTKFDGNRHQAA